jgi:hypothetical protein
MVEANASRNVQRAEDAKRTTIHYAGQQAEKEGREREEANAEREARRARIIYVTAFPAEWT